MSSSDVFWLKIWELIATIGFIAVILGVVIEGVEHFKKFTKKEQNRKLYIEKIGWFILVGGLAMEFLGDHAAKRISERNNARLNNEAGDARRIAGDSMVLAAKIGTTNAQLSLQVAQLQSTNLWLAKELLAHAQQIKEMAKTANETREKLGDASTAARLAETKEVLAIANKVAADVGSIVTNANLEALSQLKPKTLKERLIDCLDSIDKRLIVNLATNSFSMSCRGDIDFQKFSELKKLAGEPEAWRFVQIVNEPRGVSWMSDGSQQITGCHFWLYPALLK